MNKIKIWLKIIDKIRSIFLQKNYLEIELSNTEIFEFQELHNIVL